MTERNELGTRMAKAINWDFNPEYQPFKELKACPMFRFDPFAGTQGFMVLPPADAPLEEHFAFAGRVITAVYPKDKDAQALLMLDIVEQWWPGASVGDITYWTMLVCAQRAETFNKCAMCGGTRKMRKRIDGSLEAYSDDGDEVVYVLDIKPCPTCSSHLRSL